MKAPTQWRAALGSVPSGRALLIPVPTVRQAQAPSPACRTRQCSHLPQCARSRALSAACRSAQAPASTEVDLGPILSELSPLRGIRHLPSLAEQLPRVQQLLDSGLPSEQHRQLWLGLAFATAGVGNKLMAAGIQTPDDEATIGLSIQILHEHLEAALRSGTPKDAAEVLDHYLEQWRTFQLPPTTGQIAALQDYLTQNPPPAKGGSSSHPQSGTHVIKALAGKWAGHYQQAVRLSPEWVKWAGKTQDLTRQELRRLTCPKTRDRDERLKAPWLDISSPPRPTSSPEQPAATSTQPNTYTHSDNDADAFLPLPPTIKSCDQALEYLRDVRSRVKGEGKLSQMQQRRVEECVSQLLCAVVTLFVGEPAPDVRDLPAWIELAHQFGSGSSGSDYDSDDEYESEDQDYEESKYEETESVSVYQTMGESDDMDDDTNNTWFGATDVSDGEGEEEEDVEKRQKQIAKVLRLAYKQLDSVNMLTPEHSTRVLLSWIVLSAAVSNQELLDKEPLSSTAWWAKLRGALASQEKRPYRVGSGDSEKKFGVMTYIEAAEQQGVLPSLVAALYHPKLPTGKERKARLAMHTIAHIASWDSASARSVMERCLGRMPSAHWVANQREEGSAYLPEGTDDFNAALIEAFGGVIGNARHVGVGAAGWVWDEERESPVDLVVWLLSHAPASQQPAVLAAIEKGVVKLSLEECVTITQYTLAHYADVWDEDPSGFEDDEEQEELTAQQQALASFHQKMVSLLSALTSIAHSGGTVGNLQPQMVAQMLQIVAFRVKQPRGHADRASRRQLTVTQYGDDPQSRLLVMLCQQLRQCQNQLSNTDVLYTTQALIATKQLHKNQSLVDSFLSRAGTLAQTIDPAELAEIVFRQTYGGAVLEGDAQVLFTSTLRDAIRRLPSMPLSGLIKLIQAMASLSSDVQEKNDHNLDLLFSQTAQELKPGQYGREEFSRIALLVARMRYYHRPLLNKLKRLATDPDVVADLDMSALSMILCAFAILDPGMQGVDKVFQVCGQRVATLLNPKTNRGMVELARLFYCAAVADQNPVVEVPMRHRKGSKKGSRNGSATDNGATKMGLRTLLMQYLRENKDLAFGLGKSPLGQIVFALRIWSVMHPHALTDDQELIKRLFAAIRRQLDSRTSDIQNQIFEIMHDQVPSIRGVAVEATVASKGGIVWTVDIKARDKDTKHEIWVEVDGPSHFSINPSMRQRLGPTLIRDFCLKKLGKKTATLVSIDVHDLPPGRDERVKYVKNKIYVALAQQNAPVPSRSNRGRQKQRDTHTQTDADDDSDDEEMYEDAMPSSSSTESEGGEGSDADTQDTPASHTSRSQRGGASKGATGSGRAGRSSRAGSESDNESTIEKLMRDHRGQRGGSAQSSVPRRRSGDKEGSAREATLTRPQRRRVGAGPSGDSDRAKDGEGSGDERSAPRRPGERLFKPVQSHTTRADNEHSRAHSSRDNDSSDEEDEGHTQHTRSHSREPDRPSSESRRREGSVDSTSSRDGTRRGHESEGNGSGKGRGGTESGNGQEAGIMLGPRTETVPVRPPAPPPPAQPQSTPTLLARPPRIRR